MDDLSDRRQASARCRAGFAMTTLELALLPSMPQADERKHMPAGSISPN